MTEGLSKSQVGRFALRMSLGGAAVAIMSLVPSYFGFIALASIFFWLGWACGVAGMVVGFSNQFLRRT